MPPILFLKCSFCVPIFSVIFCYMIFLLVFSCFRLELSHGDLDCNGEFPNLFSFFQKEDCFSLFSLVEFFVNDVASTMHN